MQRKLTEGSLLNGDGELIQSGYATKPVLVYDRTAIKANSFRIKEWDYYYIGNSNYGIALTVADNSYMSLFSASFLDFENKAYKTTSKIKWGSFGSLGMPSSPLIGHVVFSQNRNLLFSFYNKDSSRHLVCRIKNFSDSKDFECDILLTQPPQDCMAIAIPFRDDPKAFYYNVKINCMRAEGFAKIGDREYSFSPKDSFAGLDWGRGVWTYKNTWYWASLSTADDNGIPFGFNLGYGFGDTSAATENMIFYNGIAHKTENVLFRIPTNDKGELLYTENWKIESDDNRISLVFEPILDRKDITDALIIASKQHQVFGKFSGRLVKDDGEIIQVENKLGFAERVENKW